MSPKEVEAVRRYMETNLTGLRFKRSTDAWVIQGTKSPDWISEAEFVPYSGTPFIYPDSAWDTEEPERKTIPTMPVAAPVVLEERCSYTTPMYHGWTCRLPAGHKDVHDLVDTNRWW